MTKEERVEKAVFWRPHQKLDELAGQNREYAVGTWPGNGRRCSVSGRSIFGIKRNQRLHYLVMFMQIKHIPFA